MIAQAPAIEISNLSKHFVGKNSRVVEALRGVSLTINEGEFVTILGPSGCGKSTVLNVLARIIPPSSGEALIRGKQLDAARYDISYMFQQDSVLPWRKVSENIELGLLIRGVDGATRRRRIDELVTLTNLKGFENAYPSELSGGMRKRVALATALAFDPPILLMDEPFGALDAQTRLSLQEELMSIWQRTKKTVVFVTHDIGEAIILADRIVVMTARPARIKTIHTVDLPRPRSVENTAADTLYQELYGRLWSELRPEVAAQNVEDVAR